MKTRIVHSLSLIRTEARWHQIHSVEGPHTDAGLLTEEYIAIMRLYILNIVFECGCGCVNATIGAAYDERWTIYVDNQ